MPDKKTFFGFGIFFILWMVLIYQMWLYPVLLFGILVLISFVYFLLIRKRKELYIFVIAAVIGPVGEAIVSSSGLWTYHGSTVFGIPFWLPLAWGITAVAVYKLIDSVKEV